ncbi:RnfABCDGE type electron transport complex subunit G [Vibrio mangrovi]|uniref:Ion-translocating oxidoreductase complex subunit G n=1 Tax=Vibrio mangrovi TaxID=474394 RepID=A0A1Y6IRW8_9VIBR|nr:RnfABCDGE type electron transport complex subunit G [Vibrio mangrovi]MDW6003954.1 RnfABCDGE type electron transport complex subunit G [Vibrio mangrovi]SMR99252.1 Electron transport complex protein RnfG [Vibrio mangrovi]
MRQLIEKWKNYAAYQSGLLAVVCGIAAILLVTAQWLTQPVIAQRIAEDQNALLHAVLNGKSYSNSVFSQGETINFEGSSFDLFPVKNDTGSVIAWVIRGEQEGYSGPIRYLVGVDTRGEILGVRIISHSETPGLGDKIERMKSSWILGFNHRSLTNTPLWAVKKDGGDFDQFTGATITPRSVVKGVHKALQALAHQKENGHE